MEHSSERPTDMSRERLIQELEDTREQLKRQKTLKEMFINKGKETTRELERLRKYSDDVTLSNAKIATQVRNNTKQKKKRDLHQDYEELKVAYLISEDKYRADLQEEKDKNTLLQEELDQINVRLRHEADVIEVKQQVETLQHELQREVQQRKLLQQQTEELKMAHTLSQDKFAAEQDQLRHRMTEEINNLQQNTLEKEERYERQLEELKSQLTVQISLNLELSTELKASKEAEVPEEKPCEQESNATASAPELLDVTEVSEEKKWKKLQQLQLSHSPSDINTKNISTADSQ